MVPSKLNNLSSIFYGNGNENKALVRFRRGEAQVEKGHRVEDQQIIKSNSNDRLWNVIGNDDIFLERWTR